MTTMNVLDSVGATVAVEKPLPPGQTTASASRPVVIASDQSDLPIKPGSTEAKVTAATIGTGGVGYLGWLSTIANYLAGTLTVATHAVTQSGSWVLSAGSAIIGKVGIDQTTDGTTNKVAADLRLAGVAVDKGSGTGGSATPRVIIDSSQVSSVGPQTAANSASVTEASTTDSTASRVNSAASTNATSLKASAGLIRKIAVFNNATYAVSLKIYNKASAPTVGTDTPVWTIPVPAGGAFCDAPKFPCSTGIAYAITKLQADSDTTVVAAGDLTGTILWV